MEILKKYSKWILVCFVLIGFIFLFLPCGAYEYEGNVDYLSNGFQMIFGRKDQGYVIFGFNVLGFILFLFLILCLIIPWIKIKYTFIIETTLLFISCFLYGFLPITVNHERREVHSLFKGQIALYIGLIFLILALIISIYKLLLVLKKEKNSK